MGKATALGQAGAQYLLNECEEFCKAEGDHEKRQALYDSIVTVAEALADSLDGRSEIPTTVVEQKLLRPAEKLSGPKPFATPQCPPFKF